MARRYSSSLQNGIGRHRFEAKRFCVSAGKIRLVELEKNSERKNENSDAMRTLLRPAQDAVERGDEGVQNLEGGGVTSNRDSSLNIGDPSTQRRVIFQSPLSARRKSPDSLIRRVAPLSKNGPLLTNLRVVPVSGAYLNTLHIFGHGKARIQQVSEKSEWSWLWGANREYRDASLRDHSQTTG
jgi:hypothetical protein